MDLTGKYLTASIVDQRARLFFSLPPSAGKPDKQWTFIGKVVDDHGRGRRPKADGSAVDRSGVGNEGQVDKPEDVECGGWPTW